MIWVTIIAFVMFTELLSLLQQTSRSWYHVTLTTFRSALHHSDTVLKNKQEEAEQLKD
jgi:hypothetical protein